MKLKEDKPIRVIIAENFQVHLEGFVNALEKEEDFEIVGTNTTGLKAHKLCIELLPDIAVLDISMPKRGLLLAPKILSSCPKTKIVYYSMHKGGAILKRAFSQAFHGYLYKGDDRDFIPYALREVQKGHYYFSPSIHDFLADLIHAGRKAFPHEKLSKAEKTVFWEVLEGKDAPEIAKELGKARSTIENQRNDLYKKLEVTNKTGLLQYARKHQLLPPEETN